MVLWVIALYIFSGLLMAVGLYLSMKYRLYCTLKYPEREIAMRLYKRKLMNINMSSNEIEKYEVYKNTTKLHIIGMNILYLSTPIHSFLILFFDNQFIILTGIYKMSLIFIAPMYVSFYEFAPICLWWFLSNNFDKEDILKYITIYLKKYKGDYLSEKDTKYYEDMQYAETPFMIVSSLFKTGIILILVLDLISLIIIFK